MTTPSEPATDAYRASFERDVDALAQSIVDRIGPTATASGVMLLCATRLIGHLAGHLDNVRAVKGQSRHGPEASMSEAYGLVDIGRPRAN